GRGREREREKEGRGGGSGERERERERKQQNKRHEKQILKHFSTNNRINSPHPDEHPQSITGCFAFVIDDGRINRSHRLPPPLLAHVWFPQPYPSTLHA